MKKVRVASGRLPGKKQSSLFGAGIFVLVFAVIGIVLLLRSLAAGDRLYLSPATGTVQTGSDYTVTIRLDTSTGADGIDAKLSYDQTKFQFKSIDTTTSAFPTQAVSQNSNGVVELARVITPGSAPLTGDMEVGKVTFTALGSTASTATFSIAGDVAKGGSPVTVTYTGSTANITVPQVPTQTTSYTIEPTVAAPIVGNQFGLKVYVTSTAVFQGGEVTVGLPTGLAYTGTLDTSGSTFNPATAVNGTTAQSVHLVFVTQSTTMTGKQLIATIPVNSTTTGAKAITLTGARLANLSSVDITPITADPFNITINAASLPAPIVTIPGKTQIAATENITDLKQPFTITNFDSAATYTVTLGGQSLTVTSNAFSIPASMKNGDYALLVTSTKSGASGNASYTIRLRSPNINRTSCVELLDLLLVNKGYGAASTELDLNFDGTVGLVDLLLVTGNWGGAC